MHAHSRDSLIYRMPLMLLIWAMASLAMYVPAGYALVLDDHQTSQSFFYAGTLGLFCVTLLALSLGGTPSRMGTLGQLLALVGTFAILPIFLALPVHDALGTTTFINAYLEMVSAVTTTGADLYNDPDRLSPPLHLWRALVAWLGGLLMWVAAAAILAPLSLGGFEVTARGEPGRLNEAGIGMQRANPRKRLLTIFANLAPLYAALTATLWTMLMISGEVPLTAVSHAMSVMATSGISPVDGTQNGVSGTTGEFLLFLFMFFALSRLTFASDTVTKGYMRLDQDPEFRIGVSLIFAVPCILFLRHWLSVDAIEGPEDIDSALSAFWGSLFTVASFLSTTGFVSADWEAAQLWSGLNTPGLILLGLALIGGGVATTAGGVKLLRVYALYLNGLREMERLVHPSSVSGASGAKQRIHRNGAFLAWVFFMLFALALATLTVVLTALGVSFEDAMVLTIAGLTTTGPLTEMAGSEPITLATLGSGAKIVFCAAMVIGRLETLAIIALFTPDLWRN